MTSLSTSGLATTAAQTRVLSRRSIMATIRQPQVFLPGIIFPMLIAAVNASALSKAIHFFPAPQPKSFLDFVMPATIVQGVLFGGVTGGADLALDIENGFFERLLASPVWRTAILVGRLAGAAVMGAIQVVVFVLVFTAFGARVKGGLPGIAVLLVVAVVLAVAIGALAAAIGLRTGSAEAVQNSFPLVFIMIFISSAFFPTELMNGWYKTVAAHNPITFMIDGMRHQVVVGFDLGEAAEAVGVALAILAVGLVLAIGQLRRRLRTAG